jgi:hypothetical protein
LRVADQVPACLKALGREPFPASVEIGGCQYHLVHPFKHDFFAATALYEGPAGQIVLKIGRRQHFLGIPLGWVGRFLARHEAELFRRLADLEGVPALIGIWQGDAVAHTFVPGHPLQKGEHVPDDFFLRLRQNLETMHARKMAYVDLEKCENVVVGDDGRPYLVDFQIGWCVPRRFGGELWPARWLRRRLQQGDLYHLKKLQRRTRPDQLSERQIAESLRKPWPVRLHRWMTHPAQQLRRRILARVAPARQQGERGRLDTGPEDARAAPDMESRRQS